MSAENDRAVPIEKQYQYCPRCANSLAIKKIDGKERLQCDKCSFIFWNNPKPCVSVILQKNGHVLLLQRSHEPLKGYWVLPGGYIEYDEKPEQSIIREVKEETRLDVKINTLVGVYLIDNDLRGNSLDTIYVGEILGGEPKLKEHSQFRFYNVEDLPELIAYKHREAIADWQKNNLIVSYS